MPSNDHTAENEQQQFGEQVGRKERRKLQAQKEGDRGIWFGMGMFGLVGWSVATPTLVAIAIGVWIDQRWPSRFSWTLTCLFLGVVGGCVTAMYWINRERQE